MSLPINSANVYTDLQGLDKLRYSADENSPETLRYVAQQFEAIFLQMMLKSARGDTDSDSDDNDLFGSQQTDFYQDLHDKQLAINLSSGKGIGIADMLVKQLQVAQGSKVEHKDAQALTTSVPQPIASPVQTAERNVQAAAQTSDQIAAPVATQADKPATSSPVTSATASFDSPQDFARRLWPLAEKAAQKLGVAPEMLLAQAALETGWGQKISQSAEGASSHNLFNIKADHRWNGKHVVVPTVEYRDGVAVQEKAHFRAYSSFADSFEDYVRFMKESPRYQPALSVAADSQAFAQHLTQAGYATDPNYASKIMRIAQSEPMQAAVAAIKI
jgi:flagellar protein FlgJ